jgi:hypothetical protein
MRRFSTRGDRSRRLPGVVRALLSELATLRYRGGAVVDNGAWVGVCHRVRLDHHGWRACYYVPTPRGTLGGYIAAGEPVMLRPDRVYVLQRAPEPAPPPVVPVWYFRLDNKRLWHVCVVPRSTPAQCARTLCDTSGRVVRSGRPSAIDDGPICTVCRDRLDFLETHGIAEGFGLLRLLRSS